MPANDRFITVAIHTYDKAISLRALLEREGIEVQFRNVNIEQPVVASGIRVRIRENDLPLALRIIENIDIFTSPVGPPHGANPSLPLLVPVDFSDISAKAVQSAFALAQIHRTRIVLLHTYIDPYIAGALQLTDSRNYELADSKSREKMQASAETQMRHFASRLRDKIKDGELPPVKFDTAVVEGVPEDAIIEYTRTQNPFVIIMGTRDSKQKERDMIGSVTAEVLDKCRFPVLAIPSKNPEKWIDPNNCRILFISGYEQEDILAIDTLYRLFPHIKASVTIAGMPDKKRLRRRSSAEAAESLCRYCTENFKKYKFATADSVMSNSPEAIEKLEAEGNFSIIVIPNKRKNAFSRFFSPSLASTILFAADIPMLVIPV